MAGQGHGEFDQIWEKWIGDGVIRGTETAPDATLVLDSAAIAQGLGSLLAAIPKGPGIEIAFAPDYKV